MGWYLLTGIDTLCRFYRVVASNWHKKRDSFGEVPSPAIQLAMLPMAPSVLGLRPKPPPSRREVLRRAAAVNACTVQRLSFHIPLGNDTGRVREVTSSRKPSCEIVRSHWPPIPGGSGKKRAAQSHRAHCQRRLATGHCPQKIWAAAYFAAAHGNHRDS